MQAQRVVGEIITVKSVTDSKIYIREQKGWYQRIRRTLSICLISAFVLLPLIQFDGNPAILFNLKEQTLTLFALTLYPHDLMIFTLLFVLAAFVLFYATKRYGRVWCGFACPQTVWTLMFNWIERRIEGTHHHSRALDTAPLSWDKVWKKSMKHLCWAGLAVLTSMVFMSYFVPAFTLYPEVFTLSASPLILGWVTFFALCTYINGGWIREKMCQHMCPYARFQSAMFDQHTSLVTYDAQRGEHRGPRKRNTKAESLGDCVDCGLCVQVCPVGIDIREGLQYECINCGLCADACNSVMEKFRYPSGLIGFSEPSDGNGIAQGRAVYGLAVAVTLMTMLGWWNLRSESEVGVQRDRQALYRINQRGAIENAYTLTLLNKTQHPKTYEITLFGLTGGEIEGTRQLKVAAGEKRNVPLSVATHYLQQSFPVPVEFVITDLSSGERLRRQNQFYGGEGGW